MTKNPITLQAATEPPGTWIQFDRQGLRKLADLTGRMPSAAILLQLIISQLGRNNALVTSQATLAKLAKINVRTVQRALAVLVEERWIDIRQIGQSATANAYIVNSQVAWNAKRDGIRYALFDAAVLVSEAEQPPAPHHGPLNLIATTTTIQPAQMDIEDFTDTDEEDQ